MKKQFFLNMYEIEINMYNNKLLYEIYMNKNEKRTKQIK